MSRRSRRKLTALFAAAACLAASTFFLRPEGADADQATAGDEESPGRAEPDPDVQEEAGCDPSAGGDAEELLADQPADRTLRTPRPTHWRDNHGRQCRRYHGRAFCDGPRRVPEPHGPALELARRLGLDDERQAARQALHGEPPEEWLDAVEGEMGPGLLWPVPDGRMWRGFGRHRELVRRHGRLRRGRRRRLHPGVDIGAPEGSLIRAVDDGLVVYSQNGMRGYGNSLLVLHLDGSVTLYAHCRATYVFAGQQVRRGQVVGEVGHTGLAHGDHLHLEWRHRGRPRDPFPFFVDRPDDEPARHAGL